MRPGKHICETLKGIRLDIARANDIEYHPTECDHKGDCAGTCPACESEVRWLERQLRLRQQLGKAVTIAGLSLGVSTLTGCTQIFHPSGKMAPTKQTNVPEQRLEGDVVAVPNMLCDTVEPVDSTDVVEPLDSISVIEPGDTAVASPRTRRLAGMVRRDKPSKNDSPQSTSEKVGRMLHSGSKKKNH